MKIIKFTKRAKAVDGYGGLQSFSVGDVIGLPDDIAAQFLEKGAAVLADPPPPPSKPGRRRDLEDLVAKLNLDRDAVEIAAALPSVEDAPAVKEIRGRLGAIRARFKALNSRLEEVDLTRQASQSRLVDAIVEAGPEMVPERDPAGEKAEATRLQLLAELRALVEAEERLEEALHGEMERAIEELSPAWQAVSERLAASATQAMEKASAAKARASLFLQKQEGFLSAADRLRVHLRVVRFVSSAGKFNAGEVAGFPAYEARRYVECGAAVWNDPARALADEVAKRWI